MVFSWRVRTRPVLYSRIQYFLQAVVAVCVTHTRDRLNTPVLTCFRNTHLRGVYNGNYPFRYLLPECQLRLIYDLFVAAVVVAVLLSCSRCCLFSCRFHSDERRNRFPKPLSTVWAIGTLFYVLSPRDNCSIGHIYDFCKSYLWFYSSSTHLLINTLISSFYLLILFNKCYKDITYCNKSISSVIVL